MNPQHYPALYRVDRKLEVLCPDLCSGNTYYVEAGANDGYTQSNTYFLEKVYGARGLLIEPCLNLYERLLQNRSSANAFSCCALVSNYYKEKFVEMVYANLMSSSVDPEESDLGQSALDHYNDAKKYLPPEFRSDPIIFGAQASTLTQELKKANAPRIINLLSLDIEGGELSALKGLDFSLYRPNYILAESRCHERISHMICSYGYSLYAKISGCDYLWISNSHDI